MAVELVTRTFIKFSSLEVGDRILFLYALIEGDVATSLGVGVETEVREVTSPTGSKVKALVITGPNWLLDDLRQKYLYMGGEYLLKGGLNPDEPAIDDALKVGSSQGRGEAHTFCQYALVKINERSAGAATPRGCER